jgi:hypothetical protein
MKLTENQNEIILRDIPFGSWIKGTILSFLFGSFLVWLIVYAYINPREFFSSGSRGWSGWVFAVLIYLLVLAFVALFFGLFFSYILRPVITTRINPKNQIIEVTRQGLLKRNTKRFYFSQIKEFRTTRRKASRGAGFFAVLVLENDSRIELETAGNPQAETEQMVGRLNSLLKIS